ncbi:MAG: SdiA-regulated domain-containing protein [Gemmataceae bacterium]
MIRLVLILVSGLCGLNSVRAQMPFPGNPTGTNIGASLPAQMEPSGAAWHPTLNALFTVGDNGVIARMSSTGTSLQSWTLAGDFEGIAIARPSSPFVYIADEDTGFIKEWNTATGTTSRTFNLPNATTANGVTPLTAADIDALNDSNDSTGIEALTFVPHASNPQDGVFFVGSQENGTIYQFRLSLDSGSTATYLGKIKNWNFDDLSGLEYDWVHDKVLAVFDTDNRLLNLDRDGAVLRDFLMPTDSANQEGIGYNGSSLFVAEDPTTHRVLRYDNFQPVPEPMTLSLLGLLVGRLIPRFRYSSNNPE